MSLGDPPVSLPRRSLTLVAVATLTLAGLGVNANAEDAVSAIPSTPTTGRPVPQQPAPVARGLIVQTTTTTPSDGALAATDDALGSKAEVAADDKLTGKISTIDFDQTVSSDVAADVAATVAKRDDVVWAAPNTLRQHEAASPVPVNDPYFAKQWNVWDSASKSPAGGYSVKAPSLWRVTRGSDSVRVAVLDTGILPHPDLDGQTVPGYDMISADSPLALKNAGDGDGRDPNPADPGDWASRGFCYRNSPAYPSSWHGTFVAGQIAAKADNGLGIAGVAPGVKIQPVRVLGHCGGWDSDIIAGMTWASGGHVEGIPDQTASEKARVVNLSLGFTYDITSQRNAACKPYEAAAAAGRARGSVFIAAAGNDGGNANLAVPASCAGFVSVGATSSRGFSALYSNIGTSVDLSAPGGDTFIEGSSDGIVSLGNAGTKGPLGPKYVRYEGTSMAAPQVSAAAAMLYSLGMKSAAHVEDTLKRTVSPFRKRSSTYARKPVRFDGQTYYVNLNCADHRWCGSGILDLSKVKVPLTPPSIPATPVVGEPLAVKPGTWVGTPSAVRYTWKVEGDDTAYPGKVFWVRRSDIGKTITVTVQPDQTVEPFTATSAPSVAVPDAPWVTMTGKSLTYGDPFTTTVTVTKDPERLVPADDGTVQIRTTAGKLLGTGQVVGGTAQVVILGDKYTSNPTDLYASYRGPAAADAAGSPFVRIGVGRAHSTTTSTLRTSVRSTSRATLGVTVKVPNISKPTGLLRVYDGSNYLGGSPLYASQNGTRTILLPRLRKGYHNIRVVYAGIPLIWGSEAPIRRIKSY